MAPFDQNWKVSLEGSVLAVGGLKLFRFHFGNLVTMIGERWCGFL